MEEMLARYRCQVLNRQIAAFKGRFGLQVSRKMLLSYHDLDQVLEEEMGGRLLWL